MKLNRLMTESFASVKNIHSYCIRLRLYASPLQKIAGIYNIAGCVNSFLDANKKYI